VSILDAGKTFWKGKNQGDANEAGYEDVCLLGCCAVQPGRNLPTFQRCFLPSSSAIMEEAGISKMSVIIYQITWRNIEYSHTIHAAIRT
jgi:hypothetical protein